MVKKKLDIYSVSQVNHLIKAILEDNLPSSFVVTGEISGWKKHSRGHCYFSLKDKDSILNCVMWSSSFAKQKFEPEDGMAVFATGFVDVYPPQGKYQFYVRKLEPSGVGSLELAFRQMVAKLEAEGLFDEGHKKALPRFPMRIGVVTSASGAAIRDIEESIHSRWSCAKLFLYPVAVQGEGAADEIAAALRDINRQNRKFGLDLVIVGRGGGSVEDLWAFNEEAVARAIYDSEIPVISAVGHEVDTTIADLVADARASTPTRAGVAAVPDMAEVLEQLSGCERRLESRASGAVELCGQRLAGLLGSAVFRNPLGPVMIASQRVDELCLHLTSAIGAGMARRREAVNKSFAEVLKIEPHRLMANQKVRLGEIASRAKSAVENVLNRSRVLLTAGENRLAAMNPKSVLERGYSITTCKKTNKVLISPEDVEQDDIIITEMASEKLIESKVIRKYD
ncbi:MAG: exodeoxyribonuclease VII large subunit [Planctomycetes bacterium]|nr:exodeoxyribonuclease VII large subunit [Planctomycetota bacterium]MBL7107112.1 exodeoxyribonuclease VII large subunit [Phycisphaerae bacterium]